MIRRLSLLALLCGAFAAAVSAQTGAAEVRNFVGLIYQSYHPNLAAFFQQAQAEMHRRGEQDAVRAVDTIMAGASGSGFLYSDDEGNLFVITNHRVVAQAHTVSIIFEQITGERNRIDNLRIIAVSEEDDLAILAIPSDHTLPSQGLVFLERDIEEGEQVFSAGFPALALTPMWQFGIGNVSNAAARFPRGIDDPAMMGPFIQHTTPVDAGNSGGPLLAAQADVPSGFAVAGINTLTWMRQQAANFAIPASTIRPFIDGALNPDPATFRAELDKRLSDFVGGLGASRAVYPHIAGFLSAESIHENIEYAFEEMLDRAGTAIVRGFIDRANENFIGAMNIPVAWLLEDSLRSPGGTIWASITEVSGNGEEYTVTFTINNQQVGSVWIREYGNWRIQRFGTALTGDRERLLHRQPRKETTPAELRTTPAELRTSRGRFFVETGYANLFNKAPAALYVSLGYGAFGVQAYYAGADFWTVGIFGSIQRDFAAGNFGIIPHLRFGVNYQHDRVFNDRSIQESTLSLWGVVNVNLPGELQGLPVFFMTQAGVRITSVYVPGLFLGLNFQYNFANLHTAFNTWWNNPMRAAFVISAGYIF